MLRWNVNLGREKLYIKYSCDYIHYIIKNKNNKKQLIFENEINSNDLDNYFATGTHVFSIITTSVIILQKIFCQIDFFYFEICHMFLK